MLVKSKHNNHRYDVDLCPDCDKNGAEEIHLFTQVSTEGGDDHANGIVLQLTYLTRIRKTKLY